MIKSPTSVHATYILRRMEVKYATGPKGVLRLQNKNKKRENVLVSYLPSVIN